MTSLQRTAAHRGPTPPTKQRPEPRPAADPPRPTAGPPLLRFEHAVEPFQRYLRATGGLRGKVATDVTVRTYVQQLRLFWAFCASHETTPYDADSRLCERWFERRRRVSSASRTKDLAALRHFYAFLRREGYRDDDPTLDITVKRAESLPTRPQTVDELERLLAACHHERDRLIILVLAASGLRIAELAAMRAEDVDWRGGAVKVHGKGRKERLVQLPPEVLRRLRLFVGIIDADGQPLRAGVLWQGLHWPHRPQTTKELGRTLKKIGARAGVEVHPHRLRATFAKHFIEEVGDLHELQRLMGHADANTTVRYLHWVERETALEHQAGLAVTQRLAAIAWPTRATTPSRAPGFFHRLARFLPGA